LQVPSESYLTYERVVLVIVDPLHSNNVSGICTSGGDAGHNRRKDVLFDCERARVQLESEDLDVRHDPSPQPPNREHRELSNDLNEGMSESIL